MSDEKFFPKWTPIDRAALESIQQFSTSPGIHALGTTALPAPLQQMPGVASYFVSQYSVPIPIGSNTVVGGEMAVVRADARTNKAYNYVFGSSSDGLVYFNGPFKNFPEHHFTSTSQVSLEKLFGNTPTSTKGSL